MDSDTVTGSSSSEDSEDSSSENAPKKTKVKKASSSSRHSRYSTMDRTQSGVSSKKSSIKAPSRQSAAERKSAVSQKIDSESFIKEQNEEDFVADWTITVHTHEESSELENEEDANVYIYLIGTDNYEDFTTEKFMLGSGNVLGKGTNLFKPGSVDAFKVSTNVSIGVPKKVRIGFAAKNSTLGSGWMLNKVELKNSANAVYEFLYDDWLDEKTSETVLYESEEMGPSRQRASRPNAEAAAVPVVVKKEESESRAESRSSRVSVKQDKSRSASRESNGSVLAAAVVTTAALPGNLSRASSLESVSSGAKKEIMVVERAASKQSIKSTGKHFYFKILIFLGANKNMT